MRTKDPKIRKNVLYLSKTVDKPLRELLTIRGDFHSLEEDIDVYSEYEKACQLMKKKKCSLLVSIHRNTLVLMRTYDNRPLEIFKFSILKSMSSSDFKTVPAELFTKYFIVIMNLQNKRLENLFVDFFNQKSKDVNIDGVRYSWIIQQDKEGTVTMKFVRVMNDLSIEEIGPYFELKMEKEFYCGDELYEKAFTVEKKKKQKNVTKNVFKDTVGKLHIERQDLKEINLKKSRAYKKV